MGSAFLQDAIIYLAAAVIFVPVAKRLGMGSVLGYLAGGIIIGPFFLGFVGQEGKDIMHFAEFGVVMMLFLIGLELEPAYFWRMRKMILGTGILQMGATTLLCFLALMLIGLTWQAALACGLALSMSSTAIVMQTLREKGLTKTESGKSSFAVLLFQDISVIPVLALLPLLAAAGVKAASGGRAGLINHWSGWGQTLVLLAAANAVVLAGYFIFVPFLRFIARIRLRELFTAAALLIVIATAYLMILVGLSPALGAFLAGVVLANSEFRHELESNIEPFKGILLGLFFIAVGASINFKLIIDNPLKIAGLVCGVIVIKSLVLYATGRVSGLSFDQNMIFTVGLGQVGEFAFVLFAFIAQLKILTAEWSDMMMGATAISMTVTPLLLMVNERLILPFFGTKKAPVEKDGDLIKGEHPVIIAGFGNFGGTVGRFLRANGVAATILDNDSDRVEVLRRMGFTVFYGDATRLDILKSAGADEAGILIAAIDSPEINGDLIDRVCREFPNLEVMVRVKSREDAYELLDAGVKNLYRESLDTSVRLGVDVLVKLGFRRYAALRAGQKFFKYDEEALRTLAEHRHDRDLYIFKTREQIELQEQLLAIDREKVPHLQDAAWDDDRGDS
ncbi:MAG TPA: monovalent cation:proton antiporter-2 (CPA2) family protein [Smithellaceae bacterium]|mgnify:FL=1|nr:monovalent cation:proton antiporter-2 (CPA2) family protein [Smithellaceae bacterium]HRS82625.1 monovalent cation:proton antiporter-2 (CPA2) family protein [Smithellaceae bacterium]HRV44812.1 monovalent cation:proton antiporter-2 (CPA2) family protein [Smithellaceae bacterium]